MKFSPFFSIRGREDAMATALWWALMGVLATYLCDSFGLAVFNVAFSEFLILTLVAGYAGRKSYTEYLNRKKPEVDPAGAEPCKKTSTSTSPTPQP